MLLCSRQIRTAAKPEVAIISPHAVSVSPALAVMAVSPREIFYRTRDGCMKFSEWRRVAMEKTGSLGGGLEEPHREKICVAHFKAQAYGFPCVGAHIVAGLPLHNA